MDFYLITDDARVPTDTPILVSVVTPLRVDAARILAELGRHARACDSWLATAPNGAWVAQLAGMPYRAWTGRELEAHVRATITPNAWVIVEVAQQGFGAVACDWYAAGAQAIRSSVEATRAVADAAGSAVEAVGGLASTVKNVADGVKAITGGGSGGSGWSFLTVALVALAAGGLFLYRAPLLAVAKKVLP